MTGARRYYGTTEAALAVARADWGNEDTPRAELAVCLEVPVEARGLWVSDDPDATAAAKAFCLDCPRRRHCLELAIDSGATDGTFGAFALGSTADRRRALVWLGRLEDKPRRRSPNRKEVAS